MKRIVVAVLLSIGLIGTANAQADVPITLPQPDLPDVPECRGMVAQFVLDLVNASDDDPVQAFERNRQQHPHMIMVPPTVECASKMWKALSRRRRIVGTSVPAVTDLLSLRQFPMDALFKVHASSALIGSNLNPANGIEGYQGENAISIDHNNPQHMIAFSNTFYKDPAAGCQSPTGGTASTFGTMALFGSTDGGATWNYNCAPWPATVTGGVPSAAFWFGSDPALAWDNAGRAYACYMLISQTPGGLSGASIVVARSSDNGTSWQNLGVVVNNITSTSAGDDKEMMAIDNTSGQAFSHPGRIYVIWDAANNEKIAYSDDGATWTTVPFASNTGAIGGNVVVGADGTVYVIWNRYNVETIVFSKSTDGGATWTAPAVISTMALQSFGTNNLPPAQNSRGLNAFGSIDIDRNPASAFFGTLYVAFPDFPTGVTSGSDINTYVIRSTNGGASWSSRVKVNDDTFGATQFFPWLSVDQSDGTLNVSWYDTRLDPLNRKTQMVYARSSNGGVSFEPNILVTDNGANWRNAVNYADENATDNPTFNANQYGDYAGISALNRQVHPLWTDSRTFFPLGDTVAPTRREDNATATIVNCSSPSALTAPTVNPTTTPSVVISWLAPASWGTNATSGTYSVYRNTTNTFPGGAPLVSGVTATNYVDGAGTPALSYFYFVRAKNNCPGTILTPMTIDSPASGSVVYGAVGSAVGILQGTVTSAGNAVSGATITAGTFSATTNASGFYQFAAIDAATYTVGAAATGYTSSSVPGVVVTGSATTTQNLTLAPLTPASCFTDTTYADFVATTGTNVDVSAAPGDVKLQSAGAETVDQVSNPAALSSTNNLSATVWTGQTFRAGVTGNLTKLVLGFGIASAPSGTCTVEIRDVNGINPGTTILATATAGPVLNVGSAALYTVTFGTPAAVVSGTSYSIVLRLSVGSTVFGVRGSTAGGSTLANGQVFTTTTSGATWTAVSADLWFTSYVTPPTTYAAAGSITAMKDSGAVVGSSANWTTLSWTATTPANTSVKFQAAASNSATGPFTFVGPDGTAATFFTTSGASLAQFNGQRYLQYMAYLGTTDNTVTPTLSDVTVCKTVVDCAAAVPSITPSQAQVCVSSVGNTATGPAGMTTYAWSITNGIITGGTNTQTVTYTAGASGNVGLTLTVTTSSGCQAAGSATVPILSTPAASNGGPYCTGATIALSTPTVAGATYAWTGPNGFTSALQNPTRALSTAADAGIYSVTVTIGCTTAAGTTNVVVNPIPATPTASNGGPYCAGATIALSTPTVGGATYAWTGPNGFTSALQNPTRSSATTADGGTYFVTVTISGCTSAAGSTAVVVNPTPATPTASNGGPYCDGATISLSTPTVAGATYAWIGPNGFTSALQNPTRATATTADAGSYSVTVTVSGCTSAAGTTNVVVNPIPATPTASNGGPYCAGTTIALSTPTVAGATYAWTGPNGFTSALQNPTRSSATLADAGTYSVTVTVAGCTSAAGTTTVVVNPAPATPSASNGGPYCAGATIALSTPTVGGATYAWTGPNGFTSALQNPTRSSATTADGGTYFVTTTISGCTSAAGSTAVVVNPTPATPTASNGGPYCDGATISLSTPTVAGATYAWIGPNGFTSALQNPTRATATTADAGTYSVTVTVSGCTSAAGTTNVVVNPIPATPTASNGGPYCAGTTIALSTPTVAGAAYAWTGPNGFTSALQNPTRSSATTADAGIYSVTITVGGCTSAAGTTTVVVNPSPATPTASNGGPYCDGATISLSTPTVAGATYAWTGPNGFTSALQNPTRSSATTADGGTYFVTITVSGCTSAAGSTAVVVNPIPATPTASNGGPYCEGGTISLSSPTVAGATYAWSGPNGFTSALQNPTRATATLADAGIYSVTITVGGCTSAAATTIVVVDPAPATPIVTPGGPPTFCAGGSVTLTSSSATGNQWYLNGNPIGGEINQQYVVAATGSYTVIVTVAGCPSAPSSATNVTVNPIPATPTITPGGPTTFCAGGSVTLTSSSATGNQWSLNGNPIGGATSQQYVATATGNYTVTVTASGCSSAPSSATTVTVNPIPATPTISAGGPTTFCVGGNVTLTSSSAIGNQWFLNGNPIGGATNQQYVATATGNYTVTVTASGCSSAPSSATTVTVNPIPATPTIGAGGPTTFCAGGNVTLTSSSATGNQWSLNGNPIGGATNQQYVATASGNYTVAVTASGCSGAPSSATTVTVNPIPATPTISAGGPTTFCTGGSVTLTSSSASGNQWFVNGNPIGGATSNQFVASVAGDYSVTVTASGCSSAASTATTVLINAIPNATITAPASVVSASTGNAASVASAGAGATYNWSVTGGTITSGSGTPNVTFTAGAVGTLSIQVTVSAGGCSGTKSANANVTVAAVPVTVTTVTPSAGKITGGRPVTIGGSGFLAGASVTFGGTAATSVVVVNATTITAVTPAHAIGAVSVTVTNTNASTGTLTNGYTYVTIQFDPNGDVTVDPSDIFYLVSYLFLSGPPPMGSAGMLSGDANGDGVVDPADIFYAVNYVFLSGTAPNAVTRNISTQSVRAPMSGAVTLGEAAARGNHYVIPVIVTAGDGSDVPQALSLRVTFQGGAVRNTSIHRAGAASSLQPAFEISRHAADSLSYLLVLDRHRGGLAFRDGERSTVVAEIELDARGSERVSIDVDPALTLLSDASGTQTATVAARTLNVRGTVLEPEAPLRPKQNVR
jgi:hypothetical protein